MTLLTRYDVDPREGWERGPLGLYVPPKRRRYDLPVAVELFAGAGGFGLGFHQAGFHVAAASEIWVSAALTYLCNLARPGVRIHFDTPEREREFAKAAAANMGVEIDEHGVVVGPSKKKPKGPHLTHEGMPIGAAGTGWISNQPRTARGCEQFFLYDVKNLTGALVLDALGLEVGDVAVVTGGPPCQGFSRAGKRNVMDPRNSLVFEYARLICEIMPRTFVMENVVGIETMVTPEGIPVLDAFCLAVSEGGYGEYDALRKSLRGTDARAGVREHKSSKKKRAEEPDDEQLDLFGGAS